MTSKATLPYEYIPDPGLSRAIANGQIYVGIAGTLPADIPANQKQLTARQEDGTEVPIAQPVATSAGGMPIDNTGALVQLLVDGSYSILVNDSLGVQKYYSANVTDGVPLTEGTGIPAVPFLADLIALDTSTVKQASVSGRTVGGDGYEGDVNFISGNQATNVTADPQQAVWVGPSSGPTGASGAWKRAYSWPVNVKWFGVKGDGVTDDYAAMQAAIDFLQNGAAIYVPAGIYLTSQAIQIKKNGFLLYGDGEFSTIFKSDSITEDIFTVGDGVSPYSEVAFRDVGFDASITKTAGAAVHFRRVTKGGIYTSVMKRMFMGIRITGAPNSNLLSLKDIKIEEIVASTGIGVSIENGNDHYLQNIFCTSSAGSECLAGYQIISSGAVWMDNCGSLFCGDGLRIIPGASETVSWCFIDRCAFDSGSGVGIRMAALTATSTIKGMTFNETWTASNGEDGVVISGAAGSNVDGIYFDIHRNYNNQNRGFYVQYGKNVHLNACEVSGNSQSGAGVHHGIEFSPGVSEFSVIGSKSGQQAGFGQTQAYGMVVQIGAGDNYRVIGNDFRGNVTGGLLDNGTGANTQILGNLPFENNNKLNIGAGATIKRHLSATAAWAPPTIPAGGSAGTNLTVIGASVGDPCTAGLTTITNVDWSISAFVVSADTVRIVLTNNTTVPASIALPAGTARVDVWVH